MDLLAVRPGADLVFDAAVSGDGQVQRGPGLLPALLAALTALVCHDLLFGEKRIDVEKGHAREFLHWKVLPLNWAQKVSYPRGVFNGNEQKRI